MRVGTWNLAGRWSAQHAALLQEQECDVWLLTEVSHRAQLPDWTARATSAEMAQKRDWAAVWSKRPQVEQTDPHPASAAAVVDGVYFCSSILPWRTCSGAPWEGERHVDMTSSAVAQLGAAWPTDVPLVWGGDWNHALEGREYAGSQGGRAAIQGCLDQHGLRAATRPLRHRLPEGLTIDHVAVPASWAAEGQRIDAIGLSDHDAYVVEVTQRP